MSTILKQIANLPSADCPECGGTGGVPDARLLGRLLRREREAGDIQLREIARRMDLSAPYLYDLEMGRRVMNPGLLKRYLSALENKTRKC